MRTALLVDIGGTYLRYRLGEGEIVRRSPEQWEQQLIALMEENPGITRVGIAFAGQVADGKILSAPNVRVAMPDIKKELEKRFPGVRVSIDNDLKCAALAYRLHLASDALVVLYAGSGLGSATVSEGRVVRGSGNMAGEIGHISYTKLPYRCGCGKDNCLELFASGSGIEKRRLNYGLAPMTPDGWLAEGGLPERQAATEIAEALAYAASVLITLHNPEFLVIGGGVWEYNPLLRSRVKEMIPQHVFPPALRECRIIDADIEYAPLRGAGLLFGDEFLLQ